MGEVEEISESIELLLLSLNHKDELFALVDTNREHLRQWLPWVDANQSPAHTEAFIRSVITQHEAGKGPQYAVFYKSVLCGVCGFHSINHQNKMGSIGYWISRTCSGKGIITHAVEKVVEAGFREYDLNRIEIACATGNKRSRAIPERLNFTLEGVLREREYLYGKYVDHAIYSMLASEFSAE